MTESKTSSSKLVAEFNLGEIVKARDRLWRIDKIHKEEKVGFLSFGSVSTYTLI